MQTSPYAQLFLAFTSNSDTTIHILRSTPGVFGELGNAGHLLVSRGRLHCVTGLIELFFSFQK